MRFKRNIPLSLPYQVLYAALIGIVIGLLFGHETAILAPIGRIYTMLMEVVVFPYLISTLLVSLGGLSPKLSLRLFKKSWVFYLLLIVLTYLILFLLGEAIPINIVYGNDQSPQATYNQNILKYLIPENFFADLAQNYVPAVIVFCILISLVLQHVPHKKPLFNLLNIISKTCLLFWGWLIYLVPLATFALVANIAGTIGMEQLFDVGEFLIIYLIGCLVLLFWLLPVMIASLTPLKYRTIIYDLRDALIISAITTLSVVALPYIEKITEKYLAAHQNEIEKTTDNIIKTLLLISYPLAQLGNFFVYLFMLFAALYFDHAMTTTQYFALPFISFLSSIGSPTSAINAIEFLTNWLNFPTDAVNLYVSLLPLIRYGQVLVTVMGFAFLAITVSFAFYGLLKINYRKLIIHFICAFILLFIFVTVLKNSFPNPGQKNYDRLNDFSIDLALSTNVKTKILPLSEPVQAAKSATEDSLFRIQRTGILRVGFNADMRPFVFYNNNHQLVGYDIAYAYALAAALNASIEFVPFTWQNLVRDLNNDLFDIAMSAIYVTEERLQNSLFTVPYFHSPLSMIVPKTNEDQFQSVDAIKSIKNLRIGVFNDPVLIPTIQKNFPNASVVILPDVSGDASVIAFQQKQIDAVLWSQAQTRVWVLPRPQYASIIPNGIAAPFLMAYMVQRGSPQFLDFLNYWLTLKQNDGFQQQMYNQWILIRPLKDKHQRFSLIND